MAAESNSARRWMMRKLESVLSSSIPAADARMSDDETSIQVLRAGSAIAIVFLVIYLAYDLGSGRGGASYGGIFHWVTVVGALGFLAPASRVDFAPTGSCGTCFSPSC